MLQAIQQFAPYIGLGDEFHSSAVDLLKLPPDFLTPGVFCVLVDFMIQALPQRIGERGTGRLRQL
jgi:hypothetical protein